MAQLRGDSKVGGKPIVTLDIMDNFIEQILGTSLDAKINKKEEDIITDFNVANTSIKDSTKNGFHQINNGANNDGKYNYGQLANLSNSSARFQMYAPHKEGNSSALYFRTGWGDDVRPWERVSTKTMLDEGLNKKFDKTGGDITGPVSIDGNLTVHEGIVGNGLINMLKGVTRIGYDGESSISSSTDEGLSLSYEQSSLIINEDNIKFNNNNVWHQGNLNPSDYVSRTATLLSQGTDLNTIKDTGYYRCNLAVNRPSKITGWAYIEVIKHDNNYALQKIYSYDGNHTYSRTLNNGTWTTWKPLGGGLSFTKDIVAGNWSLNNDLYEMTVTHNLGSENITSVIVTDSNKISMFTGFQVISSTVIKVFSSTNPAGKIVINAIL